MYLLHIYPSFGNNSPRVSEEFDETDRHKTTPTNRQDECLGALYEHVKPNPPVLIPSTANIRSATKQKKESPFVTLRRQYINAEMKTSSSESYKATIYRLECKSYWCWGNENSQLFRTHGSTLSCWIYGFTEYKPRSLRSSEFVSYECAGWVSKRELLNMLT